MVNQNTQKFRGFKAARENTQVLRIKKCDAVPPKRPPFTALRCPSAHTRR